MRISVIEDDAARAGHVVNGLISDDRVADRHAALSSCA
jgi:hypothetical protein